MIVGPQWRVTLLAGLVWVLAGLSVATAQSDVTFVVSHRARAVQPGEVVVIEVQLSTPVVTIRAIAFGQPVRFFTTEHAEIWQGLVGIDLTAEPGDHQVAVRVTGVNGRTYRSTYVLKVSPKVFPTRELSVDPSFVNPPAEVIGRIQRETSQLSSIFHTSSDERQWTGTFIPPVPGPSTSSFGRRSVFNGQPRSPHSGTDFRAAEGTPVWAPNAGIVVLASNLYFSGNVVIVDHGWGVYSYLAHLSTIDVAEGDFVATGDVVGKVGATGRVTGPHLHWTVRLNQARVDPLSLMALAFE